MGFPHAALSRVLGDEQFMKLAFDAPKDWKPMKGGLPLAVALGSMLLYSHLKGSTDRDLRAKQDQANFNRALEANRNAGTSAALRGGASLNPLAALTYQQAMAENQLTGDYPFDKDAAAHAEEAARALAKSAGFGSMLMKGIGAVNKSPDLLVRGAQAVTKPVLGALPSMGLKSKALVGAGVLGTGLLASKAGKKAYEFGMEPAEERRQGAPGPGLPRYTNQWGYPTL